MNNDDSTHNRGLVSNDQKQPQKSKGLRKNAVLLSLVLGGFIYLGGLGLVCVLNGGYVGVQIRELILTFSGQSKGK